YSNIYMNKDNYIDLIEYYQNDKESKKLSENLSKLSKQKSDYLKRYKDFDLSDEELSRERDLVNYQIDEIDSVDLFNIDEEELEAEYKKLSNVSNLKEAYYQMINLIDSDDYQIPTLSKIIGETASFIDDFIDMDPKSS